MQMSPLLVHEFFDGNSTIYECFAAAYIATLQKNKLGKMVNGSDKKEYSMYKEIHDAQKHNNI